MRLKDLTLFSIGVAVALVFSQAAEPKRDAGLSAHLQPERIGRLMGETGGFDVRPQTGVKDRKLFPSADAFFAFFKTLPATVQENGMWVVTTNPAAYAESEMKQLSVLEELCKKSKTPLFVARASELPNGWQRKN
jgi:hypothetical protein